MQLAQRGQVVHMALLVGILGLTEQRLLDRLLEPKAVVARVRQQAEQGERLPLAWAQQNTREEMAETEFRAATQVAGVGVPQGHLVTARMVELLLTVVVVVVVAVLTAVLVQREGTEPQLPAALEAMEMAEPVAVRRDRAVLVAVQEQTVVVAAADHHQAGAMVALAGNRLFTQLLGAARLGRAEVVEGEGVRQAIL
jgi:hypothetical protein